MGNNSFINEYMLLVAETESHLARVPKKKSCQDRVRRFDTGTMNATAIYYHRKHPPFEVFVTNHLSSFPFSCS